MNTANAIPAQLVHVHGQKLVSIFTISITLIVVD